MKDILEKSVAVLPVYFSDLLELFFAPKTFLQRKQVADQGDFQASCLFLGLSLLLLFLAENILRGNPDGHSVQGVASLFALTTFYILLWLVVLRLSWLAVNGKASFRQLFVLQAYASGPILYIVGGANLLAYAVTQRLDPDGTEALKDAMRSGVPDIELLSPSAQLFFACTLGTGLFLALVWGIAAWGAFREANAVTRTRSAMAFLILCVLSLPAFAIVFLLNSL